MAKLPLTPEGKVVLFSSATGERFERWPVDAQEMLATGAYSSEAPAGHVEPAPSPPPPALNPVADAPREYAPGVPIVSTHARDTAPAVPHEIPAGRTSRKNQNKE